MYKKNLAILLFVSSSLLPAPVDMYHDPVIFHTVRGENHFASKKDKRFSFDLVPFYHHSSGAKNSEGTKVPEGDRLGRWNMIGLLHGRGLVVPSGALSLAVTPTLYTAIQKLDSTYTDTNFTDTTQTLGHFSVPIDYEKFGVRFQAKIELAKGFGIRARSGFAHYRQVPEFNDKSGDATGALASGISSVQKYLMNDDKILGIGQEIGLNVERYSRTGLEDSHVAFYWSERFAMDDEKGDHAVTVVPHIALGAWLPTGEEKDQDIAFSLPMGNDGHSAFTAEGSINFDFPGTIQLGVGGSIAVFETKTERNFRVPTSDSQSTIYPWKTTVRRGLGPTWHLHAGFKAEDFIEGLSFYFNYIYTRHERDSISIREASSRRAALFKPKKLERESEWTNQMVHFGLDYRVSKELDFGFAVQAPITGKRTYRTTTLLSTIRFNF